MLSALKQRTCRQLWDVGSEGKTACAVEVRGGFLWCRHLTVGELVAPPTKACKGHWNVLQGSGAELTSCGIWQKQVLQQEAAGDLLVRDKAERREARGEVEMDCQWGTCGRAQLVYQ